MHVVKTLFLLINFSYTSVAVEVNPPPVHTYLRILSPWQVNSYIPPLTIQSAKFIFVPNKGADLRVYSCVLDIQSAIFIFVPNKGVDLRVYS